MLQKYMGFDYPNPDHYEPLFDWQAWQDNKPAQMAVDECVQLVIEFEE